MGLVLCALAAVAQDNDKILNRQYADMKKLHFGFSVGVNFQDINITNNGYVTDDGEQWWAVVPDHSPGFCVNVLADWRLGNHFNLRVSPGINFGNKVIQYRNSLGVEDEVADNTHLRQSQNLKSTMLVLPIDLKISSLRYHNVRPYVTTGVMPVWDLSKASTSQLRVKKQDVMLTVGMGIDIYLPLFKLCPEVKFCFGLRNILDKDRPDLQDSPETMCFTQSVDKIQNNMVIVTFNFE